MNHNYLTELPNSIGLLKNLRTLFLDENELSCLPSDVLKHAHTHTHTHTHTPVCNIYREMTCY